MAHGCLSVPLDSLTHFLAKSGHSAIPETNHLQPTDYYAGPATGNYAETYQPPFSLYTGNDSARPIGNYTPGWDLADRLIGQWSPRNPPPQLR
jgi:hypothetical protein